VMVLLAENARIPIDNPATHLELTMIHEAMLLEYSARHLALVEWASSLKLFNYACIGFALFLPWGIATHGADGVQAMLISVAALVVKLTVAGAALAAIESFSAKLRIFRAPEYLAMAFLLAVLGLLSLGAILDFVWQRQRFMERLKMTKEEVKEDVRQSDGDPHVKAKQRQIRNERAKRRMIQQVPKATVVIANPTHFAVALRYEQGETAAPLCVAKGIDEVALRIREVAEEAGVKVIEDPPLARALYGAVEIDQIIPQEHYEAVAKIIGFILSGRRRRARTL